MADSTIAQEIQFAGLPRRIAQTSTAVSVTNTTTETTLATITIPANSLGPSGFVEVLPVFTFTGTNNTRTVKVALNGTVIWMVSAANSTLVIRPAPVAFHNAGSTGSQVAANPAVGAGVGSSTTAPVRTSFDSTQALTLTITATLANAADTAVLEGYLVRVTYGG